MISVYIPRLQEVEDMIKQGEKIQMSLQRMREVVYGHQQANIVEPPPESHYRQINGYDHDGPNTYQDDAKGGGGFPPDAKKRRGVSGPSALLECRTDQYTAGCSAWPMSQL
jgi:glutamate--cysteine ligase catalytic subunit